MKGDEGSRMSINKTNISKILHTKLKDNNIYEELISSMNFARARTQTLIQPKIPRPTEPKNNSLKTKLEEKLITTIA